MISIGKIAVSVFPDHSWAVQSLGLATRAIVSEGGKLYRLFYDANDSHNPARIQSIQFTNQTDGEFKETLVHDIGQLAPWNLTTGPRAYQKALFCVGGSQIDIVQLDPSLKCQPVPRRLITGGTPSRVIFCRKINKLIVAISRIVVQPARNTNAEAPEHNNRLIYPGLKLLDPDDDSAGLPSTKEQDRISFGKSGERILGITEWQVDYAGQSYLMLLVPTMRPRRDQSHSSHSDGYNRSTASEGRIYLFNVQMSSTGIPALVPKTSMPCNDPVYSVAVYDPRSFVYGCGKKVCIRTLADHQSRLSFEWNGNAVATCNVGSPVKKITVNKPYIYATTAHDSIVVLRLENNQLIKVFSDSLARSGQHHLLVEEHSLIIGTHSDKHLCGLWQPPQPTVSGSLRIIFEAQLPGSIMRLQRVSQTLADVTNKNTLATFVGSAFDGAFYEFNVVDEAHWMLLRFIQNMAERSPAICPYTYRDTRDRSIIPSFEKYHYKQIDGDILLRILQQDTKGGHSTLQALVNAPPPLEDQHLDYGTAEERQARFIEFVENALGGHNEEDPYLRALHFLQEILQPMASDECY